MTNLQYSELTMRTYEPMAGDRISDTCKTLERMTAENNESVQTEFNGVTSIRNSA